MPKLLVIVVALLALQASALSENRSSQADATTARLGTLDAKERELLEPFLERGPVLLTEFSNRQIALLEVIYAAEIRAPAQVVAEVIGHPDRYPGFMSGLGSVDVR